MEKEGVNKVVFDEAYLKDFSDKWSSFMIKSIEDTLKKIELKTEEVNKSDNKNKIQIVEKYNSLTRIIIKIIQNLKSQTELQKEAIKLSEEKLKIEEEIDHLFIG